MLPAVAEGAAIAERVGCRRVGTRLAGSASSLVVGLIYEAVNHCETMLMCTSYSAAVERNWSSNKFGGSSTENIRIHTAPPSEIAEAT